MIRIKLFALLKERAGSAELNIPFSDGSASDLVRQVAEAYPALEELLAPGRVIISVNQELVRPDAVIRDGDEVALMPPFSGGNGRIVHVRVQNEPFVIDEEVERLKQSSHAIGGIAVFVGTTRDVSRGRSVSKLEFEHYPGMAEKKLAEIRERAIGDFGLIDVVIVHRIGTIPVGENIVLIAAAAMHRDEAFRGCRFCIDELKRITPIWKKETSPDGEVWVEEHP
jgi:molybdopterin synthase catalytic subunit/molybdopterin converting factor small subunit